MKHRLAWWLLAAVLVAGFCALGTWQWRRGVAKQATLAAQAAVLAERRAGSLASLSMQDDATLAWAAGHGHFVDAPVLLLDNQRRGAAVGVRVLAVLEPRDARPLLVDLGWLPLPGDRQLPEPKLPTGELRVSGLLAPPPGAGLALGPSFVPVQPVGRQPRWLLTRVDLPALAEALDMPLDARVLRLDPALPIGYARDLDVLPNTLPPERHRGYALQWFGLAFATLVTALFLSLRKPPRHEH